MLRLKHWRFASEIEPKETKRMLQHFTTVQSLRMEPLGQNHSREREWDSDLVWALDQTIKPSSLTFHLLMSILLLCAEVSLIWIFFSSSVTESNDTDLLLVIIYPHASVSPSTQCKWKSDRIWIQLWCAGILRKLKAWQGLELPEAGMGFPYSGHREDSKQWEGYW